MNPAVTLAFALVKRLPWIKVPVYWAAQMFGAFVASACVYGVYYGTLCFRSFLINGDRIVRQILTGVIMHTCVFFGWKTSDENEMLARLFVNLCNFYNGVLLF